MSRERSVLVVTVVHRPQDARIRHRQVRALVDAGWSVTYAAPFTDHGQPAPSDLRTVDVPRSAGRRRLRALRAARRLLRAEGPRHDVVLLHDPELLLALPGSGLDNVVWDVHEDPAAALLDRDWVPAPVRPVLAALVRRLERWAEGRCAELLLAERSYATRFRDAHPVVLNLPTVPASPPPLPGDDRVVYVGRLSAGRGARELVALGTALAGDEVTVEARTGIRLAATHAATVGAAVADTAFTLAGGTAVYDTSVLGRCLRDAHVVTQHIQTAPKLNETIGKLLLGLDVDTTMF